MSRFQLVVIFCIILTVVLSCSKKTTEPVLEVEIPYFSPPGGDYYSTQNVEIICATEEVDIFFTSDGSDPDETSIVYSGPIEISTNVLLKARAYKSGWEASGIASAIYVIKVLIPENMMFVDGGTFNPTATYSVTINSIYIGIYPVIQADYQSVMGRNPSWFNNDPNNPVETVSWFDAIEYCNRLSLLEGLTPCYSYTDYGNDPVNWPENWNSDWQNHLNVSCDWSASGYRLPTEMEWMFAAKGGIFSESFIYSGSNNIDEVAWYWNNSGGITHPVGLKAGNELEIFDMSGNVWEWCWDIYSPYPTGSFADPSGADNGMYRIKRGGSAYSSSMSCTVYYRHRHTATSMGKYNGFRVCRRVP